MKKLILLLFTFISIFAYSQIEYPRYEKDSLGQQVVILTIEQAQALDSSTDLLVLFEKLNTQILNYDSVTVKVINEKEEIIAKQDIQIKTLKEQLLVKDERIKNLQETVSKNDAIITNLDKQVINIKEQLDISKKEINRVKTKMIIGGSLGGLAIIGLLAVIIL